MKDIPLKISQNKICSFCKKHHVVFFAFFGSILTSQFSPSSDVDILVKFKKNRIPNLLELVDMESELSDIIGRNVDLKTPKDLSPYFRQQVLDTAKVVYE